MPGGERVVAQLGFMGALDTQGDVTPQPVALAADLQQHFVKVPLVARSRSSPTWSDGKGSTELAAPLADRLMPNEDAALSEQILHSRKLTWKRKYTHTA